MVFKLDPEKESKVIAMLKDSAAHTDAEIGRGGVLSSREGLWAQSLNVYTVARMR